MASPAIQNDSDDDDVFAEAFKRHKYKNAFNEENWEEVKT